jgi:predicted enzyme related to lactoylglutathione lyase
MASNFVWYELMTSDLAAAESFYKEVVGWNTEPFPGSDFPYTVVKAGDRAIGGLTAVPQEAARTGMRPNWAGYIFAEDVDATTRSIASAGGTVYRQPADIPGVGRFSVVTDPQGAMFMLLSPQGEAQPPLPPTTEGHVGWRELYTVDWKSAFDFYAGTFGWQKGEAMDMGPMGVYQLFTVGGEQTGGMMNKPAEIPHAMWLFYFNVGDIDAAAGRVGDGGGHVLNGPMEVPGGGWIVQCVDPQGAMFALVGRRI